MHVTLHTDFASLDAWSATWNELARGIPFRRWEWVETWWRHYGCDEFGRPRRGFQLFLLAVWAHNGTLIGVAPWYRLAGTSGALAVHFLGDGEVCSDYLSVLCTAGQEEPVASALADWLSAPPTEDTQRWDRLELIGIDATDEAVGRLLENLQAHGNVVHHCPTFNGWRVALPATWDEYLMILSKPHRNRLRRAYRNYFETGRVKVRHAHTPDEIAQAFAILIQLHQGRWKFRGQPGCFASSTFEAFHREISARLMSVGRAAVNWLELDGRPLAAEYQLIGDDITFAYQSGIDTGRLDDKPGHLANMASLKRAIEQGQYAYDFLRGDEPYKAHWRAAPRPMFSVPRGAGPRGRPFAPQRLAGQTKFEAVDQIRHGSGGQTEARPAGSIRFRILTTDF